MTLLGNRNNKGMVQLCIDDLLPQVNSITLTASELYGKISTPINNNNVLYNSVNFLTSSVGFTNRNNENDNITQDFSVNLIPYLENINVINSDNIFNDIENINQQRIVAQRVKVTANNPQSSRGHLFITLNIILKNNKEVKLSFVDMAGVEDPFILLYSFLRIKNSSNLFKINKQDIYNILTSFSSDAQQITKFLFFPTDIINKFINSNEGQNFKLYYNKNNLLRQQIMRINEKRDGTTSFQITKNDHIETNNFIKNLYLFYLKSFIFKNDIQLFDSLFKNNVYDFDKIAQYIYDILEEGLYINESINHLRIFLQNRLNKKIVFNDSRNKQADFNYDIITPNEMLRGAYLPDRLFTNPVNEIKFTNQPSQIKMIENIKKLSRNKDRNNRRPTKFIMIGNVRTDLDTTMCEGTSSTLDFMNTVKST